MSQYTPKPKDRYHSVLVGWDPPLSTFFAHVINTAKTEDSKGYDVYWVGCNPGEITTLDPFMTNLKPYVDLSEAEFDELRMMLQMDKANFP